MEKSINCIKCNSEYTYENGNYYVCPECGHEWLMNSESEGILEEERLVKDAHGNVLKDGDSVTLIKDLKVKGSTSPIKMGLKITNIRLVDPVNGHDIEAKIKGFGVMMLKSEFVKKC
ncbi:MAG: alkylphosphonate utilization protein [Chlamydiales bacterium]|nr:alkylphosphonate utilization protein [Chlamydiia bacterium]MCP5507145.1 alkylphosphonate utilization protein [Chlamydiales bacterium]